MNETATKGYVVTLRNLWPEYGSAYVAAATAGRAKSLVVQNAQEYIDPSTTFADVASCRRCPALDGKREGSHAIPDGAA